MKFCFVSRLFCYRLRDRPSLTPLIRFYLRFSKALKGSLSDFNDEPRGWGLVSASVKPRGSTGLPRICDCWFGRCRFKGDP